MTLKQEYIEYMRIMGLCQEALPFEEWLNEKGE